MENGLLIPALDAASLMIQASLHWSDNCLFTPFFFSLNRLMGEISSVIVSAFLLHLFSVASELAEDDDM